MGRILAAGMALVLATAAACSDSSKGDQPAGSAGRSDDDATGTGGEGGETSGKGGEGGRAGDAPRCDCGDDPNFIHVPLECARQAEPLETFSEALPRYRDNVNDFGLPFYTLLGTCASGYHTLQYSEACENGGFATYDAAGNLVYSSYGPYGAASPLCGKNRSVFADFGIGESDPARDCEYCLLSEESLGGSGGGSGGESAAVAECYPERSTYTHCDPEVLE